MVAINNDAQGNVVTMGDERGTPRSDGNFDFSALTDAARERLNAARGLNAPRFPSDADGLPEPAADQIWRARWERTATAVLLLDKPNDNQVSVAGVTFDPALADSTAIVIPANGTTMGTPAVLWVDTTRTIPLATLDRYLGGIRRPSPLRRAASKELRHFQAPRLGTVVDGAMRASVVDDLDALANATWVPTSSGSLVDLLAGVRNSELAETIGVSPAEALQIKRGQRPLNAKEAAILARVLGHTTEELVGAAPLLPPVVVDLFNTPSVRVRITTLARSIGADETELRRESAYAVLASAARVTNLRSSNEREQWLQRIDQYFDTHLPTGD